MLSPISLTVPTPAYQPARQPAQTGSQTAPAGREQTQAPAADPSSMGRMPPVAGKTAAEGNVRAGKDEFQAEECQTCKNRKYQDGSDDPGVSYKTATAIDPDSAAAAVRSHEQEHVTRNQAKAAREGKEVVSQSVTLHTAICPECGRVYVSGGTTRTVTRNADEPSMMDLLTQMGQDNQNALANGLEGFSATA